MSNQMNQNDYMELDVYAIANHITTSEAAMDTIIYFVEDLVSKGEVIYGSSYRTDLKEFSRDELGETSDHIFDGKEHFINTIESTADIVQSILNEYHDKVEKFMYDNIPNIGSPNLDAKKTADEHNAFIEGIFSEVEESYPNMTEETFNIVQQYLSEMCIDILNKIKQEYLLKFMTDKLGLEDMVEEELIDSIEKDGGMVIPISLN